jgi:hypothetical protein
LKKLTLLRRRLQSRTGSRSSGTSDNPCRTPAKTTLPPSFRTIQADLLKGTISCRIGLRNASTNAPASASTSGGVLSSREHPACQEQNSHQFGKPDLPTETGSNPPESADLHAWRLAITLFD